MKKTWIFLLLAVVIAAQWTFLSTFQSESINGPARGTSAVLISKTKYVSLRAHIEITPFSSPVQIIFLNGSQTEIPINPYSNNRYSFDVFLPKTSNKAGLGISISQGISISEEKPIDLKVVANITDIYSPFGVNASPLLYFRDF